MDVERIRNLVTEHKDFPKKGILFYDIFPIFRDPVVTEALISHLAAHLLSKHKKVDVVVGLEARGFLLAPILALRLGAAFVPFRKPGKVPGETVNASYEKEYGKDEIQVKVGAIQPGEGVVVFDDLLATGGTARAAAELVRKVGATPLEFIFVVELSELKGAQKIGVDSYSVLKY